MKIKIERAELGELEAFVEDVPGLEVPIIVEAEYEVEDTQYVEGRAVAHTPFFISINRCSVYIGQLYGEDYYVDVNIEYGHEVKIIEELERMRDEGYEFD